MNHVVLPVVNLAVSLVLLLLVLGHVHIHLRVALEVAKAHIAKAFGKENVGSFSFASQLIVIPTAHFRHRRILSVVVFFGCFGKGQTQKGPIFTIC